VSVIKVVHVEIPRFLLLPRRVRWSVSKSISLRSNDIDLETRRRA